MVYAMKEICRHGQPDKGKKSKNAYTDVVKRKICGMVGGKKNLQFLLGLGGILYSWRQMGDALGKGAGYLISFRFSIDDNQ